MVSEPLLGLLHARLFPARSFGHLMHVVRPTRRRILRSNPVLRCELQDHRLELERVQRAGAVLVQVVEDLSRLGELGDVGGVCTRPPLGERIE